MLHLLAAAGSLLAAGGLVAGVSKSAAAAIPHCAPDDPLVFVTTSSHRVYKASSTVYKRNWKLAQEGKPTPSGRFVCASAAKTTGGLPATGDVPVHQR